MESDLPHSCDTQHPDSSDRKDRTKKKPREARYPGGGVEMRHGRYRGWTSNAKEGQGLTGGKGAFSVPGIHIKKLDKVV